jgi:hypothetical protein
MDNRLKGSETDGRAVETAVIVGCATAVNGGRATNGGDGVPRGFTQYTEGELKLISQDVITCEREGKRISLQDLVSGLPVVVIKTFSLDSSHVLQPRGRLMISKGAATLDYCEATLKNLFFPMGYSIDVKGVISALKDKISGIVSITATQIQAELDTAQPLSFDYIQIAEDIVKKVQLGATQTHPLAEMESRLVSLVEDLSATKEQLSSAISAHVKKMERVPALEAQVVALQKQLSEQTSENGSLCEQLSGVTREEESLQAQVSEQSQELLLFPSLRAQLSEVADELEWQKTQTTRFHEQVLEQKLEISDEAGFQETENDRQKTQNGVLCKRVAALRKQLSEKSRELELH